MPLRRVLPLGLAALSVAACVAAPAAVVPASGALTLDFSALAGGRQLMAVRAVMKKATITVSGPDLAPLVTATQDLAAGTLVTLPAVPAGPRRLVKVQGLDAAGQPIAGLVLRTIGPVTAGANTMAVSPASNAAGRIVEALAAKDAAGATHVGDAVDYAALSFAIGGWLRALAASNPGLLDAAAIAADIHAANGAVPVAKAAYVPAPGRLVLAPVGWPPGATGVVTLDDPASFPTPVDGQPTIMGPIAPGTWTLTLTPDQPGLAPVKAAVVVGPGTTQRQAVGFGAPEARTRLDRARGGAAYGVVTVGGQSLLALAGGVTIAPDEAEPLGPIYAEDVVRLPASAQVPPLALPVPIGGAASAAVGGKLYWFAGVEAGGITGRGWAYDPVGTGAVAERAALPGGLQLYGPSAAAVGSKIYLTGGLRPDGTASRATFAYDPAANGWTGGLAQLDPERSVAAAAAVGETMYLFGGFGTGEAAFLPNGAVRPLNAVSSLKPGTDPAWRQHAAMPTPRAGAAAVAVGTRVFVIGGVTRDGGLTGAVEVYDAATDTWSLRPPLGRARALAAAGLVGDRIVVAGGLLGDQVANDAPVDDVEAIVP